MKSVTGYWRSRDETISCLGAGDHRRDVFSDFRRRVCPCVGVWNYGDWAKWDFRHNIVWGNEAGNYQDIWDQSEINGNLSVDPKFIGEGDFHLQEDSPAWNAGDTLIFNTDGTVSHIGLYGGPQAREK